MATVAESAVLVSSAAATEAVTKLKRVQGPSSNFDSAKHVLDCFPSMGFQATNFGHACHIAELMLRRQAPSKVYQIKDGKYVLVRHNEGNDEDEKVVTHSRDDHVYPDLFLGVTANLFGTGCREAIRFLVQEGVVPNPSAAIAAGRDGNRKEVAALPEDASEDQRMFARLKDEYCDTYGTRALADEQTPSFRSFLCSIVVSGGAVEHDVRRACASYTVSHYASEAVLLQQRGGTSTKNSKNNVSSQQRTSAKKKGSASEGKAQGQFGNVSYPAQGSDESALFDCVMQRFVARLQARQHRLRTAAAAKPIPETYLDVCSWSVTPSEVWALLGLWLVDLLTEALHAASGETSTSDEQEGGDVTRSQEEKKKEVTASYRAEALQRARSTVVYWAAVQQVPLFSPSFVDGDISAYLLPHASATSTDEEAETIQVDLVRDIHAINKLAMQSKKTGMLICGGGVVKHHVCNANLMRNGADYTIILNNGQEFDGSDAGAKPEEALSWGKVRMEGDFVKVYGEITTYLPLLVAQVFLPAVRRRQARLPGQKNSGGGGDEAKVASVASEGDEVHADPAALPGAQQRKPRHRRSRRQKKKSILEAVDASTTSATDELVFHT